MESVMNIKSFLRSVIALSVLANFSFAETTANLGNIEKEITIPLHSWHSQQVASYIVGSILKQQGYNVSYVDSTAENTLQKMASGEHTLEIESWSVLYSEQISNVMDRGGVVDAGSHQAVGEEGIWVSQAAIKQCKNLPNWRALNKCYLSFSENNAGGKSRRQRPHKSITPNLTNLLNQPPLYTFTPEWQSASSNIISKLNLRFREVQMGSHQELLETLEAAYQENKPIAIYNWHPSWTAAKYNGQFVQFPGHKKSPINKLASHKMPHDWPFAYYILRNISFSNIDIAYMTKFVEIDQMSPQEAADYWIETNQDKCQSWLS